MESLPVQMINFLLECHIVFEVLDFETVPVVYALVDFQSTRRVSLHPKNSSRVPPVLREGRRSDQ